MGRALAFTLLSVVAAGVASVVTIAGSASAASCLPRAVAPGTFPNPRPNPDAGIITQTFLDLRAQGLYHVSHGVDLSDHNKPNYDQLKFCGTEFAIIKLYPSQFSLNQTQVKELSQQNIQIIPYYYLEMPGRYKYFPEQFANDDALPREIADAVQVGQADATAFLQGYHRLFGASHPVSVGGLSGDLVALDVEEAFDVSSAAAIKARGGFPVIKPGEITPDQYDAYGQTYSAMVASWVKTVQAGLPGVTILFYTYPAMYITYLVPARTADYNVFHGLPIWLAEPTQHGGDLTDADMSVIKGARQLCFSSSGGNKCIIHQYTARGLFGQIQASPKAGALHLDLDRLFWVDPVADGIGVQYVRKADPAAMAAAAAPAAPVAAPTAVSAQASAPPVVAPPAVSPPPATAPVVPPAVSPPPAGT